LKRLREPFPIKAYRVRVYGLLLFVDRTAARRNVFLVKTKNIATALDTIIIIIVFSYTYILFRGA